MYNEKIKQEFLNQLNYDTPAIERLASFFESIEPVEQEKNIDICNLNPDDYPIYISQAVQCDRYSYFLNLFSMLTKYREYCRMKNYINPILFFTNNTGISESYKDNNKMLSWLYGRYKEYCLKDKQYFYTGDQVIDYVAQFYQELDIYNFERLRADESTYLTQEEIITLYLCLVFFGIPQDLITTIEKNNIIFSKNAYSYPKATIVLPNSNNTCAITGKAVSLLKRAVTATYVQTIAMGPHSDDYKLIYLNDVYLLCLDEDYSLELAQKRSKKIYYTYYKHIQATKDNGYAFENDGSVKNFKFQGIIHRMAIAVLKMKQSGIDLNDSQDILLLYEKIANKQVRSYPLKHQILDAFNQCIDYLETVNYEEFL